MRLIHLGVALGLTAALCSVSAYAWEHRKASTHKRHQSAGYQTVAVTTKAGDPGHGWQYFFDRAGHRAVVINPSGDYYYSHGKGLELVYKAG